MWLCCPLTPDPSPPLGARGATIWFSVASFQCSVASEQWVWLVLSGWAHAKTRRREGRGSGAESVVEAEW